MKKKYQFQHPFRFREKSHAAGADTPNLTPLRLVDSRALPTPNLILVLNLTGTIAMIFCIPTGGHPLSPQGMLQPL